MEEGKMSNIEVARATGSLYRKETSGGINNEDPDMQAMDTLPPHETASRSNEQSLADDSTSANSGAKYATTPAMEAAHEEEASRDTTANDKMTNGTVSTLNGGVAIINEAADASAPAISNLSIEAMPKPNENNQAMSEKATKPSSAAFDPDKCVTCQAVPGKYKCPRCLFKYCSVACNKLHKATHDYDPEPSKHAPQPVAHPADEVSEEKIGLHGRKLNHPYKTLQHSEELKWLFNKYPRLPDLLLDIYGATEPPPSARSRIPASLMMALPENQQHDKGWSQERRIYEGRTKLRAARSEAGEDGEAIREYCLLVSSLLDEAKDR